jgi:hypothetical protein
MADPVIRLDKTKPHGTVHGDRMPEDPHYKVAYWQGGLLNGKRVQLPFDVHGELIPDDGRTVHFQGAGQDAKGNVIPVHYQPLYTPIMREFLAAKLKRAAAIAVQTGPVIEEDGDTDPLADDVTVAPDDEVNFAQWLKGEANYAPRLLRDAARKRYGTQYREIYPDLVIDLVFDHNVVKPAEVAAKFQAILAKANFTDDSIAKVVADAPRVDRKAANEEAAA